MSVESYYLEYKLKFVLSNYAKKFNFCKSEIALAIFTPIAKAIGLLYFGVKA